LKKIILTPFLIATALYSSTTSSEIKIINKISLALTNKSLVFVHTDNKESLDIIFKSKKLRYASTCEKANLILTDNKNFDECKDKRLVFATNYLSFKSLQDAVGAFFYQKGRPNIVFRKEILEKHNISLPEEFDKFIK